MASSHSSCEVVEEAEPERKREEPREASALSLSSLLTSLAAANEDGRAGEANQLKIEYGNDAAAMAMSEKVELKLLDGVPDDLESITGGSAHWPLGAIVARPIKRAKK